MCPPSIKYTERRTPVKSPNLKTRATSALAASLAIGVAAPAMAADVVIGVPNWPSVRVTANVLKVVMEENLGLEVELQNGTNPVVFEAMDSGAMHVHPEVWLPNQSNLHDTYVKDKGTVARELERRRRLPGHVRDRGHRGADRHQAPVRT